MVNARCIPSLQTSRFRNSKVNFSSMYEIMVLGKPCNMKICFIKMSTTSIHLKVYLMRKK
jgi:hypothetical protein